MMIQPVRKNREQREKPPSIPFRRRIGTKAGVVCGVLCVFICSGTWYNYYHCKQAVYEGTRQRGLEIARRVSDEIRGVLLHKDHAELATIIESLKVNNETHYLVVCDAANTPIFSQFKEGAVASVPDISQSNRSDFESFRSAPGEEHLFHLVRRIVQLPDMMQERSVDLTGDLGTLYLGLSLHAADQTLRPVKINSVLLTGGTLLLSFIGLTLLSRIVVKPLDRLSVQVSNMAAGDLRQSFQIASAPELQWLEVGLSNLASSFREWVTDLKRAKEQIALSSEEVLTLAEEHVDVHQKQVMLLYQILQNLEDITASSGQSADSMAGLVQEAESGLYLVMNAERFIQNAIDSIEEIREQVEKNTERVVQLGEKIAQIDNVVKIITTIADQTKLIAFNASIEAAGAGEAGGRFSVVATEVRRLANTVVESVEEMKNSVSSIQTAASELILSSETGIHKVNQGTSLIAEIGQTLQQRLAALNTIAQVAQKISDVLQQQQLQTTSIVATVKDTTDSCEQTLETAKRISEIAKSQREFVEKLVTTRQQFFT